MGGTKKPTISKLKKMAMRRDSSSRKGEEKKRDIYKGFLTSKEEDELKKYILKQRYITPSMLARRGEVRISIARRLLRKLKEEGLLELLEKHRDVEIYAPVSS